jgi:cytochrome c oxidase cbb3-type subunit III
VSKDTNRLLGHTREADGIDEYDNPLPDWWLGLFWFTIIWGIGYFVHYHFIAHRSQEKELAAEMAAAEARWPAASPTRMEFTLSPEAIAAGETIYQTQCIACHGANLEGGIGAPLNDTEWIHGGTPEDIVNTITNGVLAKGMPAWGPILGPEGVNEVAAYVVSRNAELTGR